MRNNKNALTADIAFLCMLLLTFLCVLFLTGDPQNLQSNSIILAVVLGATILTYFTNLTTGLVINLVLIFIYMTYVIFMAAYYGAAIQSNTYFWVLWTPCMTTASYLFSRRTLLLEEENTKLHRQLTRLSGVDTLTELKNMRSFERDCNVYMKISKRYSMELGLIVWEFRYQKELAQIIGAPRMEELAKLVSTEISASLREEDAVYLLDSAPYSWGTLLFTNAESTHIVIDRVESRIRQIDLQDLSGKHDVYLEMRVGSAIYSDEALNSPLTFLSLAKQQTEYNVQ